MMHSLTMRSLNPFQRVDEDMAMANIRANLERKCQEFAPALVVNDGHFVICGSGPSLPSFVEEIRNERKQGRTICAIKGAHDLLCENGIEPDCFVTCDPKPKIEVIKHANEKTIYLLASRVHPALYDLLEGKNVVMWHSAASMGKAEIKKGDKPKWEDLKLTPECDLWKGRFAVGGGTTSGLRAVYIGFLMGFRKFILYGMDSCLAADNFTKRFTGENIGPNKPIDVIVNGRRFFANGAMALQASEFQEIYNLLPITVEAKGDGLIAAIIKARKERGLPA